ncbi:uncharacterized protein LOC115986837 isoform X1 [Quercus lobata]|uniref:uncharacterized protein LOC115986837 isoform X1 n=1 Tax=Quercus lobata TaxID=97700 RepID=UPI0012455387|nr:uncharacterized protein LOC115986837 isoform X1 [Quercus lobata]
MVASRRKYASTFDNPQQVKRMAYCLRESDKEDVVDAGRTLRRCEVGYDLDKGMYQIMQQTLRSNAMGNCQTRLEQSPEAHHGPHLMRKILVSALKRSSKLLSRRVIHYGQQVGAEFSTTK